jgi:sulfide:quinone oxidoreductase
VLFGVKEYVPALMKYIETATMRSCTSCTTSPASTAREEKGLVHKDRCGRQQTETVETTFDMIHVVPPQTAPDFIRVSPLADAAGWVDVDQNTLRHKTYENIWSLGDVMNAPNAKTAAAARKQAPGIVANNVMADMGKANGVAIMTAMAPAR